MQIVIRNMPLEMLLQSVTVSPNPKQPDNMYLFHCFRCGYQIVQVKGIVTRIFPGLEPTDEIPVVSQCPRCRERFVFITKPLRSKRTKVVLSHNGLFMEHGRSIFRCFICRTPLLYFDNKIVISIKNRVIEELPLALDCTNLQCPQGYVIVDAI